VLISGSKQRNVRREERARGNDGYSTPTPVPTLSNTFLFFTRVRSRRVHSLTYTRTRMHVAQYDIALERRLAEPNDLSRPNHVDFQEAASTPRSSDVRSLPVMVPCLLLLIYVYAYGLQKTVSTRNPKRKVWGKQVSAGNVPQASFPYLPLPSSASFHSLPITPRARSATPASRFREWDTVSVDLRYLGSNEDTAMTPRGGKGGGGGEGRGGGIHLEGGLRADSKQLRQRRSSTDGIDRRVDSDERRSRSPRR
jgi:hypothetical protein